MPASAAEVIRVAKAEIGTHEGHDSHGWNNIQRYSEETPDFSWSDGQPWCDTFVAWCSWKAGFDTASWPRSASCDTSGTAFKKIGRWSEYPAVGAQVFFGTPSDLQHTGIVTAYDDTYIHTVEGNTNATGSYQGDGVYAKIHERRDARVIGYGYPRFPEGIVSADPAWQKQPQPVSKAPTVRGVDISHYQDGPILYGAAQGAGVRFIYHKATEGTTYADPRYSTRRAEVAAAPPQGLLRRRIHFGAYHFARPKVGNAADEAAHFLSVAQPARGDMVPMLDLEDNGGLSRAALTTWVGTWVAAVEKACGSKPIIYTHFDLDYNFGCRLWVARYSDDNRAPVVPQPWKRWDLWQFSDGVYGVPNSVPGLGHVDLDTMRPGLRVRKLRVGRKVKPPTPKPVGMPQQITVAAHNGQVGHHLPTKRRDIDELEVRESIDVVLLSEWGTYGKALPAVDHARYKGEGKVGQPSTPCDYRPSIFAPGTITTASVLLSDREHVPASIPGPADTKPKYGNQVAGVLADALVPVRFVTYHGNVQPNTNAATKKLRKEQVDALVKLIGECHQRGEIVVLGGDFNCKADDRHTGGRLAAAGLTLAAESALMQIWVTATDAVSITGARVITDTNSDHDVPVVTLTVSP